MSSQQKIDKRLKGLVLVNVPTNGDMNVSLGQIMRHMDKNQIINLQDPIEANLPEAGSKSFEKIFTKPSKKYDYKE